MVSAGTSLTVTPAPRGQAITSRPIPATIWATAADALTAKVMTPNRAPSRRAPVSSSCRSVTSVIIAK